MNQRIAVLDFETTGITPGREGRATEIGIVLLEGGQIVDRYQSLMNAGVRIPSFITQLTGISNAMVQSAPDARTVMSEAARFVADAPLVAHNAAFDSKFWDYELGLCGLQREQAFACTLLLSRRLLPQAPDHKLGTLTRFAGLPATGRAHRALADAEMAANLWLHLQREVEQRCQHQASHALFCRLQKVAAAKVGQFLQQV